MTAKYISIRQKIGEKCIFLNAPIIPVPTGQKKNVLLPALRDTVLRIPACPQDLCLCFVLRGMCPFCGPRMKVRKNHPVSQRRRHWGGLAGSFVISSAAASEHLPSSLPLPSLPGKALHYAPAPHSYLALPSTWVK